MNHLLGAWYASGFGMDSLGEIKPRPTQDWLGRDISGGGKEMPSPVFLTMCSLSSHSRD